MQESSVHASIIKKKRKYNDSWALLFGSGFIFKSALQVFSKDWGSIYSVGKGAVVSCAHKYLLWKHWCLHSQHTPTRFVTKTFFSLGLQLAIVVVFLLYGLWKFSIVAHESVLLLLVLVNTALQITAYFQSSRRNKVDMEYIWQQDGISLDYYSLLMNPETRRLRISCLD